MDIDHDGFITKSELSEAMKILGHNLTEEEVETMIKDADKNGDNKITNKWLGVQLTSMN